MAPRPPNYNALGKGPIGGGKAPRPVEPEYTFSSMNQANVGGQDAKAPGTPQAQPGGMSFAKDAPQRGAWVDKEGDEKMGDHQTYQSVGEAGSGFVNLSHLLDLNKASGMKSAKDLAKRTKDTGTAATGAISSLDDEFTRKAREGMAWNEGRNDDVVGTEGAWDRINQAKGAQYTGPGALSELSGYADLAKKVGSAEDMAKNVAGGPYGVAAQVNKETGLSPVQSAASSFYMGVSNPNLKKAGSAFSNLGKALEQANARSMQSSQWARGEADRMRGRGAEWERGQRDLEDPRNAVLPNENLGAVSGLGQPWRKNDIGVSDEEREFEQVKNQEPIEYKGKFGPSETATARDPAQDKRVVYDNWVTATGGGSYDDFLRWLKGEGNDANLAYWYGRK